jgi:hypothetical protein
VVFGNWHTASVSGLVLRGNTIANAKGAWFRYYTGHGPELTPVAMNPAAYWLAFDNRYRERGTGGGLVVARGSRGPLGPDDQTFTLAELQARGTESGSRMLADEEKGMLDLSANPVRFGAGSETLRRMATPRSTEDARAWLRTLGGTGIFVQYDETLRVRRDADWGIAPTKIAEFLVFADLKQAVSHSGRGAIRFEAELSPGHYDVHVRWYGDGAERAPQIALELDVPGSAMQALRIDHRQEAHKWLKVGTVEVKAAGLAAVTARNLGDGATAMNAVAWTKTPTP